MHPRGGVGSASGPCTAGSLRQTARMDAALVPLSKFVSLVLRHDPGRIGLRLDGAGWAEVDALLAGAARAGVPLTRERLDAVVAQNEKRRFAFDEDGTRIRASQGHSVPVDLGLTPVLAPDVLFHGTAERFLDAILAAGLEPRGRQHVHLSGDRRAAVEVGRRHGRPVVLAVDARAMQADGHVVFRSENGVWLTAGVPARYLSALRGPAS